MTKPAALVALFAVAVAVAAAAWKPWAVSPAAPAIETPEPADPPKFAQDRGPMLPAAATPFDADRAEKYLKQLCDLGPRISGSAPMLKQQELLVAHFEACGAATTKQAFDAKQASRRDKVAMTNLTFAWHPDRPRRVILCAHYDTRPMAHEEPNRQNWNRPFTSANDGTSGVAMLMEMAHALKTVPTTVGVDVVFFDGEEYIFEPTGAFGGGDRFFIGSEYFADEYKKSRGTRKYTYEAAVLFDLFVHPGAVYRVEANSWGFAPRLAEQVWKVAAAANAPSFKYEQGPEVADDHLALNRAGIPAVDVIDFDGYRPHWHRLTDTPDRCSGKQMAEVARVMFAWLQVVK